jgi:hypothetical protein
MSSKRVRVILLSGFLLIAVIICIGLVLVYGFDKTTTAALPEPEAVASAGLEPTDGGSASDNSGLNTVAVNAGNVQAVISSLSRPESYKRHVRIESFYGSESAVYDIDTTVDGSESAMKIVGPGGVKYIILTGGRLYVWYEGDQEYNVSPADALGDEQALSDEFQMILTYEDVVSLNTSAIRDAGYTMYGNENCIYVQYVSGALKYTSTCYVSVASGLLTGAEQYDGHVLVYRMSSSVFEQSVTDNSAFILPDGKNALSVP